ncbi:hypothetical protein ACF0H5_005096 [Mactra antiquata]
MKKKNGEVYPLLTTDWLGTPTYRQKPVARHIRGDDNDEEVAIFDDEDEVFNVVDQKKKRSVNLVWLDVFLLVVDFLQIFALIQSMALRWTFPEKWLRNTYFLFGINLDVWEIYKFTNSSVYKSVQSHYLASSEIGVSYSHIVYGWFGGVGFLAVLYATMHLIFLIKFYPQSWPRRIMSWVQFFYVVLIHVLSLPMGIALFRLYECEGDTNKVYTMNEYDCYSAGHWKLAAPALVYIFLVFVIYPAFLVWKIRQDGMTGTSEGYLSYILMKETEYKIHVNKTWLLGSMWIFSSFKHRGRYYKSTLQIVKLALLITYAAGFQNISHQSLATALILLFVVIIAAIIRPFRLTSCNVFLIFSLLCNLANTFVGSLVSFYNPYTLPSAWLTSNYVTYFLLFIQVCWLVSLLVLLMYLISRTICHSTKSCYKRAVWPNIATSGTGYLTSETRKFMTGIIKAKIMQEKIQRIPPMFAPVHDLARHIQIINTYCREAEYIRDPLHMVLWEVLDDLVETHAYISPKSLFAETVKKNIRRTATEFMTLIPMFSQRLAQRDYDFILIPPKKKRMLLKMYCMGVFLNGRSEKVARNKLLEPAVEKVWPPLPADREFEEEDGYYEDLYPQPIGDNYSDDLLNVIVDESTDAETTEEEDNVQGVLRNLPEVGVIDLETPMIGEPDMESESEEDIPIPREPTPPFGKGAPVMRPVSATSKGSSSSSQSSKTSHSSQLRPGSGTSSLFASRAKLRQENTLSPTTSAMYMRGPTRPDSAGSLTSGRSRSPVASGTSVIGSQPSLQEIHDDQMTSINPGYVPDNEDEDDAGNQTNMGDNPAFIPDNEVTMTSMATSGDESATEIGDSPKKKVKKPKEKKKKNTKKKQSKK